LCADLAARFRKDRQARGPRRVALQNEDVELVAINDPFIDTEYIVHSCIFWILFTCAHF
jgi:hypothetical protein